MDQRQAYEKKAQAELDLLEARLQEIRARAQMARADVALNLQQQINELKARRDDMRRQMEQMSGAGQDAWQELKQGFGRAAEELRAALDRAADRLK